MDFSAPTIKLAGALAHGFWYRRKQYFIGVGDGHWRVARFRPSMSWLYLRIGHHFFERQLYTNERHVKTGPRNTLLAVFLSYYRIVDDLLVVWMARRT